VTQAISGPYDLGRPRGCPPSASSGKTRIPSDASLLAGGGATSTTPAKKKAKAKAKAKKKTKAKAKAKKKAAAKKARAAVIVR
jgi:hypothetical protein